MTLAEIRTGKIKTSDGTVNPARADITGALVSTDGHGRYQEPALKGNIYYAANQAATTWSVSLNIIHTGFVVSNPIGSNVNLVLLQICLALTVAPAAISHIGIFGGYAYGGLTVHTTPLIPGGTIIGSPSGVGKADSAATLVGTPVWIMPILGGLNAGGLYPHGMTIIDIGGSIIVPPGGYAGIGALTSVVGFAGMFWEEVPI